MNIEQFTDAIRRRDEKLAKRVKQGHMNRFGEEKVKKPTKIRASNKHDWLNAKEVYE